MCLHTGVRKGHHSRTFQRKEGVTRNKEVQFTEVGPGGTNESAIKLGTGSFRVGATIHQVYKDSKWMIRYVRLALI